MRVLELGSVIVPAYAGMILAEQGHDVEKWTAGRDPVEQLRDGDRLWAWLNDRKRMVARRLPDGLRHELPRFDGVIDNLRASTLERWEIDPAALAAEFGLRWVSLRADVGEHSF